MRWTIIVALGLTQGVLLGGYGEQRTTMIPYSFHNHKTPEDLQQEKTAEYAEELKRYLSTLTPEARAKFWADIEGKGDDQENQKPSA